MLGIEPETFEFERENRTYCAIKIEKNMYSPDFYRKNKQIYVMFRVLSRQFNVLGVG